MRGPGVRLKSANVRKVICPRGGLNVKLAHLLDIVKTEYILTSRPVSKIIRQGYRMGVNSMP